MLKAVIFDLDGTLVDSTPLQIEANRIFIEGHGKLYARGTGREGLRIIDIVEEFKDVYDLKEPIEDLYQERQTIYFGLVKKHLELFPGVFELLDKIKAKNLKIALATSGDRNYLRVLFEKFPRLKPYFSVVISSEDVIVGKPNPEVFKKAAEKLGVDPKEAIVVEDSVNGILAARAAHMPVVCVPNKNYPDADYTQADKLYPDLVSVATSIQI